MATGTIKTGNELQEYTPTAASLSGWTVNRSGFYRVGNLAFVKLVLTWTADATSGTLYTMPTALVPRMTVEARGSHSNRNVDCQLEISTAGALTVSIAPANAGNTRFWLVYPV